MSQPWCCWLLLAAFATSSLACGSATSETEGGRRNGVSKEAAGVRRSVSITAVGDTMLGSTPTLPPSPGTYFEAVAEELRGDIVFGNLEGSLTNVSESPKCEAGSTDCFAFRAPPSYAQKLHEAGFTVMSNANNHSFDFGQSGEDETVRALRGADIAQTGLPGEVTVVHAADLRVAFLGFAPYSNTASLTEIAGAQDLVRRAVKRADIVVCAIHAGAEGTDAQHVTGEEEIYLGEDRGNAREFTHAAIDAGADLILGSGPHVLRGMEVYRGRLIAYSLGNFAGFHNFTLEGPLGDSVILHVTLAGDGRFRDGRLTSVRLVEAGQPVPDPNKSGADLISTLSEEDFGASAAVIGSGGRVQAPR
jgi:poly-gamma-glutamate capsule biosynthesis protein CapA/YwtB (metallophosphatase superfamily)